MVFWESFLPNICRRGCRQFSSLCDTSRAQRHHVGESRIARNLETGTYAHKNTHAQPPPPHLSPARDDKAGMVRAPSHKGGTFPRPLAPRPSSSCTISSTTLFARRLGQWQPSNTGGNGPTANYIVLAKGHVVHNGLAECSRPVFPRVENDVRTRCASGLLTGGRPFPSYLLIHNRVGKGLQGLAWRKDSRKRLLATRSPRAVLGIARQVWRGRREAEERRQIQRGRAQRAARER